jgi:hypothetical protein
LAVLEGIPRVGDYVVSGRDPDRARRDLKRPWEAIRTCAGLGDIRLHDLRHSFAATGAASNLGLPIIGKLLGHKRAETTSRYAHIAHPLPFYPKAQIRQGADRHSPLKVDATAVDNQRTQDNEKNNRGGYRPPIIFGAPWLGPPTVVVRSPPGFKVSIYHR